MQRGKNSLDSTLQIKHKDEVRSPIRALDDLLKGTPFDGNLSLCGHTSPYISLALVSLGTLLHALSQRFKTINELLIRACIMR